MFSLLEKFIEIINDLELSLLSWLFMTLGFPLLWMCSVSNLGFPVDDDDQKILGTFESLEHTYLLAWPLDVSYLVEMTFFVYVQIPLVHGRPLFCVNIQWYSDLKLL